MTEAKSEPKVQQWAIQEERDRALAQLALLRGDLEAALSSPTPYAVMRAALARPAARAEGMVAVYQLALDAVRAHHQPPTPANLRASQAAWAALDYAAIAADESVAEVVVAERARRAEAQSSRRVQEPESWGGPDEGDPTIRRPVVVCLCGSTRFGEAFRAANLRETLAGRIVLTIGCDMRSDAEIFSDLPAEELVRIKADLDALHLRKIELADEVLVLNVGGYIGQSTRAELAYARQLGKRVRFLEAVGDEGQP